MWETVIILSVLAFVIAYSQTPKTPKPKPPTLEDININTAEQGRPIPVVFGTRVLKSGNVAWYGDLRYKKITSKGGK